MLSKTITFSFALLVLLITTNQGISQVVDSLNVVKLDSTTQTKTEDNGYGVLSMFDGNPGKAALFSLVIPGAGQAFNKRWWKIPLALAAEGTVIYILRDNIRTYNLWDTEYRNVVAGAAPALNPNLNLTAIENIRNSTRQNKDYAWVALIGVHIIVAADAFVDRHLIEFDVEDDLKVSFSPISPLPGVNLVVNF